MERLTKRITENQIELSAKANPKQYVNSPQRVHMKHPFWNVFNRLEEYEDLEEQGLLLRLPCPIGTTVYVIVEEWEEIYDSDSMYYDIYEEPFHPYMLECIGKEIFLTYEEAETKLRELQSEVADSE